VQRLRVGAHDHGRCSGLRSRTGAGASIAGLLVVLSVVLMVLVESRWEPLARLDHGVAEVLNASARGESGYVQALDVIAIVSHPWVFRTFMLVVTIWLWVQGARPLAVWVALTMTLGGLLGAVLKLTVERPRPTFPEPVAHANGFSFPSGHALNSMLAVGILTLVAWPAFRKSAG
jgi:membrane-associated phospholipid phosphatase